MRFGFSYVGLIFLVMVTVPNLFWTKNRPEDYDRYSKNENKVLLILERIGNAAVTTFLLVFRNNDIRGLSPWLLWLAAALILMLLYEAFWIRYFRSEKTMKNYYSSILGIPVAGATLPVIAFMLLAVYGRNIVLGISVIILGIGHIGIHLMHKKEAERDFGES
jgi:hypothetical protein